MVPHALRQFAFAAIAVSSSLLLCGCPDDTKPQKEELPFKGLTVEITVPAGLGLAASWNLLLDEWSEQTGASASVVEVPMVSTSEPVAETEGQVPDPVGDLVFFPLSDVSEYDARLGLSPFPEKSLKSHSLGWTDLFLGLRDRIGSLQGQATALPVSCPVLVCYFRRDLLEAANRRPPTTWEEYRQLVQRIEEWAPGLVAVEPWCEGFRSTMFLARAVPFAKHPANYSLFFDIYSGEPLIDSPGYVRALELTQQTIALMPSEVRQYSPEDCRHEILEGRAAIAIAFETAPGSPLPPFASWHTASASNESAGDNREPERPASAQIGFCRLPGATEAFNRSTGKWERPPESTINHCTLIGFAGLCAAVPSADSESQQAAACHVLQLLARNQIETAFAGATKSLCRDSQMTVATEWLDDELTMQERIEYVQVVADSLHNVPAVAEIPVVGRRELRSSLTKALGRVLANQATPADGLQEVASEWKKATEKIGVKAVRDSYRCRIGLEPRGF